MRQYGPEIVGEDVWQRINAPGVPPTLKGRFPLLLKFLDAAKNLSVQVHPNDDLAAQLTPPDLGKSEAWYVMDAAPGATIYAGLKTGVTREDFSRAVESGKTAEVLHSFQPRRGDCVFIPAGTIHAIGAGLLILEIQQASNTTWRVFDWNRVDTNGKGRELHIDQAVQAIDFQRGPIQPEKPSADFLNAENLITCNHFSMSRLQIAPGARPKFANIEKCKIMAVTKGQLLLCGASGDQPLDIGQTMLLPAHCRQALLQAIEPSELIVISVV